MAGMDVDSPTTMTFSSSNPRDRIIQRLASYGVPRELLDQGQAGLVSFVWEDAASIPEIVYNVLPTDGQVLTASRRQQKKYPGRSLGNASVKELFGESLLWIQWLMFKGDPHSALKDLAQMSAGERGVCGAVWGQNDLAYRCRTCENDSTCAICVPCFQNGNHKDHDYSTMYTGGGCCDCGDETAWKREGFCSKHKGAEQIQPLSEDLANSAGPVLDALFGDCWKQKLLLAEERKNAGDSDSDDVRGMLANNFSSSVVEMLLEFCNCSESLLSFVSRSIAKCDRLLEILVRAEGFLDKKVARKLHELLLKLLGEPLFKYELGKVFVRYYPAKVSGVVRACSDSMLENYPMLSTFSVQIFTVPTLTPRLVREENLLVMLLGCLKELFLSCVADNGHLQVSKWANLYETTIRIVEDTRYVMSHNEVTKYVAEEQPDISRYWIWLLSLVQGMDAQKRVTGPLTDEDNENLPAPFVLAHYLGNVSNLLVEGAFSAAESKEMKTYVFRFSDVGSGDGDGHRHAKVGRTSQESSACTISNRKYVLDDGSKSGVVGPSDREDDPSSPSSVAWLILECLKAIESCLGADITQSINSSSFNASGSSNTNSMTLRKKLFKIRKGTASYNVHRTTISSMDIDGLQESIEAEYQELAGPSSSSSHGVIGSNMDAHHQEDACMHGFADDVLEELDSSIEFNILNMADWPGIVYDVSSQEVSIHLPLHRLLSLLLRKTMRYCYAETGKLVKADGMSLSGDHYHFFVKLLGGLQPCGFSATVMEHPLRLRVFCAQVHAGMWRKNGDTPILCSEWYRAVQWLEQGLESDLFLLQCCAALAPPELFVKRIQERFGLVRYTSLDLTNNNGYEPVLVQEMLTLIIQIIQERRFCGLSSVENLRRELVYKLATGDATHSQLVKALPRDLSKNDQLQNVLDMLADYSNPSGLKQGKYSLRKEHWKELDLYHPRWTSKEIQIAQERYLRFCKVSAANVQLPRWTYIYEPLKTIFRVATSKATLEIVRAVIYYAQFTERSSVSRAPDGVVVTALHLLSLALDICEKERQIGKEKGGASVEISHADHLYLDISHSTEDLFPILTCANEEFNADVSSGSVNWKNQSLLSLLVSLMRKYREENLNNYAESRNFNISSFIENLLKKFAQLSSACLSDLKRLAPDFVCQIPLHSSSTTSQNTSSVSDIDDRKAKARERQAAIMAKMRAEQSKFLASVDSAVDDETGCSTCKEEVSFEEFNCGTEESKAVCSLCRDPDSRSPVCFLVLVQRSRLATFVDRGPPSWNDAGRPGRETLSAKKGGPSDPSSADSGRPIHLAQNAGLELAYGIEPTETDAFLDFFQGLPDTGNVQTNVLYDTGTSATLSIEMMENDIFQSVKGEILDTVTRLDILDDEHRRSTSHVATESSVLREYVASLSGVISRQNQRSVYDFLHIANLSSRTPVSTAKFSGFSPRDSDGIHLSSCGHAVHQWCHDRYLLSLKQRNIRRLGFEAGHFVEPDMGEFLCPVCRRLVNCILPALPGVCDKGQEQQMLSSGDSIPTNGENNILHLPVVLSLLQSTSKVVGQGRFLKLFSRKPFKTSEPALEPVIRKLSMLYYPHNYSNFSASGRLSQSVLLWDTLRYSLVSTEIASRGKWKANRVDSVSCMDSLYEELHSSGGFILSLLLHVAQTARNFNSLEVLLRFRGIQFLAGSICYGISSADFTSSDKRRGALSSILEHGEKGEPFPDSQFWRRVADPILAHDPFSSLMWVLFCLPFPFKSSTEFFIPLVHLFYVVCIVQATITCYNKQFFDLSSFDNSPLKDVCKAMAESELGRKYFASNYIDTSCAPNEIVRRLTLPYLRRCALLWRLLKSSPLTQSFDCSNTLEGSRNFVDSDALDVNACLSLELSALRELEDMFQIRSLELIFKDEYVHYLAVKWSEHFCRESKIDNSENILCSTPAIPFKLMQLPKVYQDLLQRYIKWPCSSCNNVPDEPALCLLCGMLCSPSWKSCCRASKCVNHAMVCGAGIGVFLLVKKTTILLQRSSRQAVWPSPYLDAFGEEDVDMYRGKPLFLSKDRYNVLTHLMASHGFDRSSEVLRQTTTTLYGSD